MFANYVYTTVLEMMVDHDRYFGSVLHLLMAKQFNISGIQLACYAYYPIVYIAARRSMIDIIDALDVVVYAGKYALASRLIWLRRTDVRLMKTLAMAFVLQSHVELFEYTVKFILNYDYNLALNVALDYSQPASYAFIVRNWIPGTGVPHWMRCRTLEMYNSVRDVLHLKGQNVDYDRMLDAVDTKFYGFDGQRPTPQSVAYTIVGASTAAKTRFAARFLELASERCHACACPCIKLTMNYRLCYCALDCQHVQYIVDIYRFMAIIIKEIGHQFMPDALNCAMNRLCRHFGP